MRYKTKIVPAVLLMLLMGACAKTPITTPVAPTPPQVQVANYVNVLAQGLPAAGAAIIAARDAGTLSPEHTRAAQNVMLMVARTGKQINAILRTTDPWPSQKAAILMLILTSGVQEASKVLPPSGQAAISASMAVLNQILVAVGGTP